MKKPLYEPSPMIRSPSNWLVKPLTGRGLVDEDDGGITEDLGGEGQTLLFTAGDASDYTSLSPNRRVGALACINSITIGFTSIDVD